MDPSTRIHVAGHRGLVGSALLGALERAGCRDLLLRTRAELDLADAAATDRFYAETKPEVVFLAAARVGGIHANSTYPADFIRDNLAIQLSVIEAAHRHGAKRLIFLGSSCIYPRECPQPMAETSLLTGPLESTNRPYALAKIAGIEMCSAYNRQYGTRFLAVMPTNLYGPGDNYDLENSHVLPALIRKMHEARVRGDREVVIWGSGTPRREFLYSDDLAEACLHLAGLEDATFDELLAEGDFPLVNVGVGEDLTVRELAELTAEVVGFHGDLVQDTTRPDGTPRKLLDVSKMRRFGWRPRVGLREGIVLAYEDFLDRYDQSP
ncbi:MAG: GDP-L-fucose synthase, partial [Gammaproteobacteria bacterium]|nr:GDP-L-fucose synthase [Gammaproteobacteria bacterium]